MSGKSGLSGNVRAVIAAQKSAEGIVAGRPAKARTMARTSRTIRSCVPCGRKSRWNWPWRRWRRVKPGTPVLKGPKCAWRVSTPNALRPKLGLAPLSPGLTKSIEPPCTDPYARWCGRGGAARLPPIPIINSHKSIEPPCTDPYARWCGRGGAARLPPIPIINSKQPKHWPRIHDPQACLPLVSRHQQDYLQFTRSREFKYDKHGVPAIVAKCDIFSAAIWDHDGKSSLESIRT